MAQKGRAVPELVASIRHPVCSAFCVPESLVSRRSFVKVYSIVLSAFFPSGHNV